MLEDDVGRVAEDLLDALGEARAITLKRAFSSSRLSPPLRIMPANSLRSM